MRPICRYYASLFLDGLRKPRNTVFQLGQPISAKLNPNDCLTHAVTRASSRQNAYFGPEDEDSMFLRNVALQSKGSTSSVVLRFPITISNINYTYTISIFEIPFVREVAE
jgi:hypothetical protein